MRIILINNRRGPDTVYVCICNAVTERQLREAIDGGAETLAELRMDLGVAAGCGCCASTIEAHLAQRRASANCGPAAGPCRASTPIAHAALVSSGTAAAVPFATAD